jgi:hypothetical protein
MGESKRRKEYDRQFNAGWDAVKANGPTDQQRTEAIQHHAQIWAEATGKIRLQDVAMPNGRKPSECSPEYFGELHATMYVLNLELPGEPKLRKFKCRGCDKIFYSDHLGDLTEDERKATFNDVPLDICEDCNFRELKLTSPSSTQHDAGRMMRHAFIRMNQRKDGTVVTNVVEYGAAREAENAAAIAEGRDPEDFRRNDKGEILYNVCIDVMRLLEQIGNTSSFTQQRKLFNANVKKLAKRHRTDQAYFCDQTGYFSIDVPEPELEPLLKAIHALGYKTDNFGRMNPSGIPEMLD